MQHDAVKASRLATTIVATVTSNTNQAAVGGNVFVPALGAACRRTPSSICTPGYPNNNDLDTPVGRLPTRLTDEIDQGPRLVLGLP